jgi:hypothetical protein
VRPKVCGRKGLSLLSALPTAEVCSRPERTMRLANASASRRVRASGSSYAVRHSLSASDSGRGLQPFASPNLNAASEQARSVEPSCL